MKIDWNTKKHKEQCPTQFHIFEWFYFILTCLKGPKYYLKARVHLKAVFTPLKIGSTEISRSRFKQYKNPMLITQINGLGCFVNFWVIFRYMYIWEEIVFLNRVVKLREIRTIEDLVKF